MQRPTTILTAAALAGVLAAASAAAHHSFAMFDLTQHKLVEGVVMDWHYNNPHSWLHIEAMDDDGELKRWSFEGAATVHAARQGVNGTTYRKGERVRVVMSPIKDGRNAGALCFVVKQDGSLTRPNDGVCDAEQVISTWQTNSWLESAEHLAVHPSGR